MITKIKRFKELVEPAKKIVISTHTYPDADGIGSQIALCLALNKIGKQAICVNEEPLMDRYRYLDCQNITLGSEEFFKLHEKNYQPIDLFIVVDTNSQTRIGNRMERLVQRSKKILYIDHHPCPPEISALHCIDTTSAATGQLVGNLILSLGVEINQEMALPLYTAIVIDTSSFRYPTVTASTHQLIATLLKTGITPPKAYNQIYGTKKISHMQLLGSVLSSAQTNKSEEIAWIVVKEESMKIFDADPEDTHAFINHLLVIDKIKIACMFRNIGHNVKISFRSAGDVDVGLIALSLGGGGHNHSSATIVEGNLNDVIPETIKSLEAILNNIKVQS